MRAQFLVTCLCDLFYPEVAESAVRLLARLGVELEFPAGQTCCGQPGYNSGFTADARRVAQSLIEAFAAGEADQVPVVAPSGSCVAMVRHYYPRLFAGDDAWRERALAFGRRVFELSEFIVRVLGVHRIAGKFPAVAVYHRSCHMTRGLGVVEEPRRLLSSLEGLELVDLPHAEECCGFGGTFSVKMDEIATAMADAKLQTVRESGAQLLIGADAGCLMHLAGRLRRLGLELEVMHLAQVLERATRSGVGA